MRQDICKPGDLVEVLVGGEWHGAKIESFERSFYTVRFDPPITIQEVVIETKSGGFLFLKKITTTQYKKITIRARENWMDTRPKNPANEFDAQQIAPASTGAYFLCNHAYPMHKIQERAFDSTHLNVATRPSPY